MNGHSTPVTVHEDKLQELVHLFQDRQLEDDFESNILNPSNWLINRVKEAPEKFKVCVVGQDSELNQVAVPVDNNKSPNSTYFYINRKLNLKCGSKFVVELIKSNGLGQLCGDFRGILRTKNPYQMKTKAQLIELMQQSPEKYKICRLQLDGPQLGWAYPLSSDDPIQKIQLKGRSNCGRACDDDEVIVEVKEIDENGVEAHGVVVGVWRQKKKLKYKLFVCEVIEDYGCLMRPICNTFPKISYDNQFAISKHLRNLRNRSAEVLQKENNRLLTSRDVFSQSAHEYCNRNLVSVYKPMEDSSTNEICFEGIGIEKVLKHDCDKLFIVCFDNWIIENWYPRGRVVHVVSKRQSFLKTIDLISVSHSVPPIMRLANCAITRQTIAIEGRVKRKVDPKSEAREDFRTHFTLTIDNPDTKDMDDAISLHEDSNGRLTVGVHITDVAEFIGENTPIDQEARRRGTTFYPSKEARQRGVPTNHMLPRQLAEKSLSLVEGQDRRCLSVVFNLNADGGVENWRPYLTLIRSDKRLNKEDVQRVILGTGTDSVEPRVASMLLRLWSVTRMWRVKRLGQAAFVRQRDEQYPETSALVEELMVAANAAVGEFLRQRADSVPAYPIRVQHRPRETDVTRWMQKHGSKAQHSAELSRALQLVKKDVPNSQAPFLILNEDAENLIAFCQGGHKQGALSLLYDERRFPHLRLAISDWHGLSQQAQYVECTSEQRLHFSLDKKDYVHFTSPMRRYADLLVHRALRSYLKHKGKVKQVSFPCSGTPEELFEFLTTVSIRDQSFERSSKSAATALELRSLPRKITVQVTLLDDDGIVFKHDLLDNEPKMARLVQFRFLNLCEKPEEKEPSVVVCCKWKARIVQHTTTFDASRSDEAVAVAGRTFRDPIKVATASILRSFRPRELLLAKEELLRNMWDFSKCNISSSTFIEADISDKRGVSKVYSTTDGHGGSVWFYRDIRLGDEMNAQIGAQDNHGMMVPTLNLLEVCDTFSICLAHRRRPADRFERAIRRYSKPVYQSIDEYVDIWQNIVALESASVSVTNNESFVLCDVPLMWQWDQRNQRWLGMFNLTENFCMSNNLFFTDSVVTEKVSSWTKKIENFKVRGEPVEDVSHAVFLTAQKMTRYSEYICLRANMKSETGEDYTWVGHGGVLLVFDGLHCRSKMCNDRSVHFCNFVVFHLNEVSPGESAPQERIRVATVELVMKFLPIRRHELVLQTMRHQSGVSASYSLVRWDQYKNAVGVDALIYKMTLMENKVDSYAIHVTNEQKTVRTVPCNKCQNDALEKAMDKRVCLIWGPPGTGKTTTGVMLVFWFAFINRKRKDAMPMSDFQLPSDDEEENDEEDYSDDESSEAEEEYIDSEVVEASLSEGHPDGFQTVQYRRRSHRQSQCSTSKTAVSERRRWQMQETREVQSRRQILCCGPSNRSVDVIVEATRDLLLNQCPSMVRVYSEQVERVHYPIPGEFATTDDVAPAMRKYALHELIRSENSDESYIICGFDTAFRKFIGSPDEQPIPIDRALKEAAAVNSRFARFIGSKRLRATRRGALELAEEEAGSDALVLGCVKLYKELVLKVKMRVLQNFDVILCTTSVSCSSVIQRACRFVQIIIDEAGMCTQPELLVPIVGRLIVDINVPSSLGASTRTLRGTAASQFAERVVLIGDHKQLAPIIQNKTAAELGLNRTFLEMHCLDSVMLNQQYRMHPSLADFPSKRFYAVRDSGGLRTQPSKSWTGVLDTETQMQTRDGHWNGLNWHKLKKADLFDSKDASGVRRHGLLTERNANVFHGCWPGVRRDKPFDTLPDVPVSEFHPMGEEERIVFLHIEGQEERTLVATEDGREDSYKNEQEIYTVVRVYKEILSRLSGPDRKDPRRCVALMSQYRYQVAEITRRLQSEGLPMPTVSTVIACQGSEFAYVLLSLVRSMPGYDIEENPLPGWERKFLGFITDENQTNVALTRAQRGLIIVGNKLLLRRDVNWSYLLHDLEERGCIPMRPHDFPMRTGDKRKLTRTGRL